MWKRSFFAALVLAGFASMAGRASAQENFGAKPAATMGAIYNQDNQRMLLRQSMDDEAKSNVTPEQRRRAQKAAGMIKANQCEDAYKMALAEEDYRLAGNIAVACKANVRQ
ncbi:hypothetical protein [Caulobacter sp. X]|uniref:hypothetical protein n=1 Tax=Caulobacter sp. X TaxID=2048901 RepID=UPI000C15859F|nr:hypothetical protein [Caulobacter sp. X]PIB96315.1 hypothetical protein CSW60_17460 [Caulobacter sp. X]